MDMQPVNSTNISEAGWEDGVLAVTFRSGGTYEYSGVSEQDYMNLMSSTSPGSYLAKSILPRFKGAKA